MVCGFAAWVLTLTVSQNGLLRETLRIDAVIRLDDLLKREGLVGTGGEAKLRIQNGEVLVNGEIETRRRRQLKAGDVVEALGERLVVENHGGMDGENPSSKP